MTSWFSYTILIKQITLQLKHQRTVKNIICQADSWGSLECGLQVDSIGKESLKAGLEPYKYKKLSRNTSTRGS